MFNNHLGLAALYWTGPFVRLGPCEAKTRPVVTGGK